MILRLKNVVTTDSTCGKYRFYNCTFERTEKTWLDKLLGRTGEVMLEYERVYYDTSDFQGSFWGFCFERTDNGAIDPEESSLLVQRVEEEKDITRSERWKAEQREKDAQAYQAYKEATQLKAGGTD